MSKNDEGSSVVKGSAKFDRTEFDNGSAVVVGLAVEEGDDVVVMISSMF